MDHLSDRQLYNAVRAHNEEALGVLFLRYHDQLLRYGLKITTDFMLVQDNIQEIFIQLLQNSERYSEIKNFKAYLFTSFRRSLTKRLLQESSKEDSLDLYSHAINIKFAKEELQDESSQYQNERALVDALNQLPWRQREAIFLRYYNDLSTKEIAQIMGISKQTVLNTVYKGLKKLKNAPQFKRVIYHSFLLIILLMFF